ncbi:MAG: protein kinase [Proteobacteria bacterium]|nr:protein kinase [Pseudomonadota bacterium]MBU1738049.1 protein kinase [Pseudomonadota bacterium]
MREEIGRYQVLRKIGRGGMGEVFKALDPDTGEVVAVKTLRPFEALVDIVGFDRLRELFISEAETMSFLDHPAVVNILGAGKDDDGTPYFVMEFFCNNLGRMIGEGFRMESRSRLIRPAKVLDYGRQLLHALSHLHRNRVVHRDIKPFNIMITDNDLLRICDFGSALVDDISFSGVEGVKIGSPFYAAPEQNRDPGKVDARADLYSAGVLLYRMVTGELPSMRGFSLSQVNPAFDPFWDEFFARALSLQPDSRFQSAEEMNESLGRLKLRDVDRLSVSPRSSGGEESEKIVILRKVPLNVCGRKALAAFDLDELFLPENPVVNDLVSFDREMVLDRATGLVWQFQGSDRSMTLEEAGEYLAGLNREKIGGRENWRLPTVSELLSLLHSMTPEAGREVSPRQGWLWSSDLHGRRDAWYVNLDMGYVDWQDVSCRNFVRAVSDEAT